MKSCSLLLVLSLAFLTPACRNSEVDTKPAAEVTDTSATTVTSDTSATTTTAAATSTEPTPGAQVTKVVKEKSSIGWVGAKVTRDHKGGFKNFDGFIEYAGGQPSRIGFEIDLDSIFSDTDDLTKHLKSPDFFDVAKYPQATFVSTSLTPATGANGQTHELKGVLDMHGVKKEVTIPVKAETTADGVRTTSEFTINRHDWGISYKGMADDLIKDNVLIKLDLLFPPPPAA